MEDSKKLLEKYNLYKKTYYEGNAIISDDEFDAFEKFLKEKGILEEEYVGFLDNSLTIKHTTPMLSLKKTRELKPILNIDSTKLLMSYKLDGNAVEITYQNGMPITMSTRGNGTEGHNISNRLKFMDLPSCKKDIIIRGEIVISEHNFNLLNNECEKRGIPSFKRLRNTIAGLLNPNRKDDLDLIKFANFLAYDLVSDDQFSTESSKMNLIMSMGFSTPVFELIDNTTNSLEEVIQKYKNYLSSGNTNQYLTDGLVFSVESVSKQKELGFKSTHPEFKIAYKLINDVAVSEVKDITYDIGKSGKLSVVAVIEPVELSGAVINNASLYNIGTMKNLKIGKGTLVEIVRSGEIIPKIIKVVDNENSSPFPEITCCPFCGSTLEYSESQIDLYCNNKECSQVNIRILENWVRILDVKGISRQTITKFYNHGIIKTIADFKVIDYNKVLSLEGFQERSVEKLQELFENVKEITISEIIQGSCVPLVGKTYGEKIKELFDNEEEFLNFNTNDYKDQLISILGNVAYYNLINSYQKIIDNFYDLKEKNWTIIFKKQEKTDKKGINFVITGTLSKPRKEVEQLIKTTGNLLQSSVNKETNYLVTNETNSSSSKFKNALKLGVTVITESELYQVLNNL